MTRPHTVSVVVPNYNGEMLLARLMPPLLDAVAGESIADVIVADAASSDASVALLRARWPGVVVVAADRPMGFAANCNRGVALATGDIVVCLNTDVSVSRGFLAPLVEPFSEADVFAVGPRILRSTPCRTRLFNENVHRTFYSFGLLYNSGLHVAAEPAGPVPVSYLCAAAIAVRRTMFEALGGFDTLYDPFYWEDLDLCYRAWARGWRVLYQPASEVRHEHRATISRHYAPDEIETILERNRWLFAWKNLTDPWLSAGHVACLPVKLLEGTLRGRWAVLRGFCRAWAARRDALRARSRERVHRTRSDRALLRQFRQSQQYFAAPARRGDTARPT